MSHAGLLDTHNIIVSAIRNDVAAVAYVTVGDCTLADVDDHDPLGLAFYTYALLETGYTNQELASFTETWEYWIEEKLSNGNLSPYTDRDLAAIGLIIHSLCRHRACPESSSKFAPLVEKYFTDEQGLFDNFLAIVLVALGLKEIPARTELYERSRRYIDTHLRAHSSTVFNDPKNFVVVHIWAKQIQDAELLNTLRHECLKKATTDGCLPRDLVYLTYVLYEEVESLPREQKPTIRRLVEASLQFIQNYSIESGFSAEIVDEFADDIALAKPDVMRQYGYPIRPRLSRILLAVGHMIEQRYARKPYLLLNSGERKRQWLRGLTYPIGLFFLSVVIIYVGYKVGFPLDARTGFTTKELIPIALSCLKGLINTVWTASVFILFTMAGIVLYQMLIAAKEVDEIRALQNAWEKVREAKVFWIEILLALLISGFLDYLK